MFCQATCISRDSFFFYKDNNTVHIRGVAYERNGFRISGFKLGLHRRFTYGNLCKRFGRMDANRSVVARPGVVKQRNITYISVGRCIEILTNIVVSSPKVASGRGDNREYEVGRHGRNWERIDDHIEEETTSYKFKM